MKRALIATLLLTGCTPYTTRDKLALGVMIGANIADYSTTIRYVDIGGTEANLMLDDRPSHGNVLTFKAISTCVAVLVGELWPKQREEIFWTTTVISGGAAVWNDRLYEKHK